MSGTLGTPEQPSLPEFEEMVMGWPIGWTALTPFATDKYREWLRLHSEPSRPPLAGSDSLIEGESQMNPNTAPPSALLGEIE